MGKWTGVVIHHTAGADGPGLDIDEIKSLHLAKKYLDIGYHFLIERIQDTPDETPAFWMVAGRPLSMAGAAAPGTNRDHIQIALAGDFTKEPPPEEMLAYAAAQIRGLCEALEIPKTAIKAHRDVNATECPGRAFALAGLVDLI